MSTSPYIQANTEGRLHPADQPSISPLNRGFLYGDAIYEVWRTYSQTIFAFEEHWRRLEASAQALHLLLPLDRATLLTEINRTAAAFFKQTGERTELYIRLQITRGAGAIGLDTSLADQANYIILVQSLKPMPETWRRRGMKLSVARDLHRLHAETINPAWKTGNYLNNILCLREARSRGADEVVMTNLDGQVTEAAVSNLFFVRDQMLFTPPPAAGILVGITRRMLLEHAAPRAGIEVREEPIHLDQLASFQESFISSTTKEIMPVSSIDETRYATGENTVTEKLQKAFAQVVQEHVRKHPEFRIG